MSLHPEYSNYFTIGWVLYFDIFNWNCYVGAKPSHNFGNYCVILLVAWGLTFKRGLSKGAYFQEGAYYFQAKGCYWSLTLTLYQVNIACLPIAAFYYWLTFEYENIARPKLAYFRGKLTFGREVTFQFTCLYSIIFFQLNVSSDHNHSQYKKSIKSHLTLIWRRLPCMDNPHV